MRYRFQQGWTAYTRGVRDRYQLLMTPAHRGFFVPWLAYVVFVAVAFRWETDLLVLAVLTYRHCVTPSIGRLQHEAVYLPIAMLLTIGVMMISLIPVQKGYVRAVPLWIAEALVTLLPISIVLTLIGLAVYWTALSVACS